ncbi:hypothetical protein [Shumkonia mesophila]|uniref:hypothetical protein n=1 Tax=Shumkonia mesophila TaxID=2838854 RepID=UPI0029351503|nr:hypothetical protein [Shumkonia mesophila]
MNYQAIGRMVKMGVGVGLYMFGAVQRATESLRLYNQLQRLDDDELAALGIPRDRIGRHVAENMDPVTLKSMSASMAPEARPVPAEDTVLQRRAA